jgi:hypothetical protein
MNRTRSGERFVRELEAAAIDVQELALVGYKEQYLLYLTRPTVNFGHARWNAPLPEARDAAAWMAQRPGRALLMTEWTRPYCFTDATSREVGLANRERWYLVSGQADPECIAQGNPATAREYIPPAMQTRLSAAQ